MAAERQRVRQIDMYTELMNSILGWAQGLLTPIIAIIVARIAYDQYRTAKDKLRLDLFDKRFVVYKAFDDFRRLVQDSGNVELADLQEFHRKTEMVVFLFDSDIIDYRQELYQKAVDLRQLNQKLDRLDVGDERTRVVKEESKLLKWFIDQINDVANRFAPYLRFEKIKK